MTHGWGPKGEPKGRRRQKIARIIRRKKNVSGVAVRLVEGYAITSARFQLVDHPNRFSARDFVNHSLVVTSDYIERRYERIDSFKNPLVSLKRN